MQGLSEFIQLYPKQNLSKGSNQAYLGRLYRDNGGYTPFACWQRKLQPEKPNDRTGICRRKREIRYEIYIV